jgi:hypothetical protein
MIFGTVVVMGVMVFVIVVALVVLYGHSNNNYASGVIPPLRETGTIVSTDEQNYQVVVSSDMDENLTLILPHSEGVKYVWDDLKQGTQITFLYFQQDYDVAHRSVKIYSYELTGIE